MSNAGQYSLGVNISDVKTLTGNSGGAIGPNGSGNINLIGTGDVSVVGNAGLFNLTVMLSDAVPNQFNTNSGSAVPASSILNILGGTNVTTSGTGSTVTINSVAAKELSYTAVTTTPYVVLAADQFVGVDTSGGAKQVNLPNAPSTGRFYNIKDATGNAATNNITLTTVGGTVTIDGATTYVMTAAYQSINVIFSGTEYKIY